MTDPDVIDRLARIETKIDDLISGANDQEHRLRKLEHGHARLLGFGVAASGVVGFLASYLKDFIRT
jgi:hypothetical protein